MAEAKTSTTKPAADTLMFPPSRRGFLSFAAGASATAAAAVITTKAAALPQDDSALLKLEEEICEQYTAAAQYDEEIMRLSEIWQREMNRAYRMSIAEEALTGKHLTPHERWKLVADTPECKEHDRLCQIQEPFIKKMEALIEEMFATPAHTAEGRRAKVTVLLSCILGDDWCRVDEETEWRELKARKLLIEFIGGEPGEQLRDQFA
jgi:hypothetical protein